MDIEHLEWDSKFFNKKVGKILLKETDDLEHELVKASPNFDLIYIFSEQELKEITHSKYMVELVDIKIDYFKELSQIFPSKPAVNFKEIQSIDGFPNLVNLALSSGTYSRFKLDENFSEREFEKLYKIWLARSVDGTIADHSFGITDESIEKDYLQGFVTLKHHNVYSRVGLIAVSENARGKGLGSKLMGISEYHSIMKGSELLKVATQKRNTLACRFYESLGYKVESNSYIYHCWKKNNAG